MIQWYEDVRVGVSGGGVHEVVTVGVSDNVVYNVSVNSSCAHAPPPG